MNKIKISISTISIISLLGLTSIVFCFCGYIYFEREKNIHLTQLMGEVKTNADQLSKGLSIPVWNFDEAQLIGILESALLNKDIEIAFVELNDKSKTVLSVSRGEKSNLNVFRTKPSVILGDIVIEENIVYSNEIVGKLTLFVTTENIYQALRSDLIMITCFTFLLIIVMITGIYFIFYIIVIKPLKLLEQFSLAINFENPNSPNGLPQRFFKELDHLSLSLQNMLHTLNQSYKKLEHSERVFKDMANLLPQVVYEMDLNGNMVFLNEEGLKLYGLTMEDIAKGLNVRDIITSENHIKLIANINLILNGELPRTGSEYLGLKKDGSTFPMIVYSSVVHEDDKPIGVRGIGLDLTEQKKNEAVLNELMQLNFIQEKEKEKLRVLSLMEGQETERLRISREIHDGIGQLMTVIKLSSESIDPKSLDSTSEIEKLEYTKRLIVEVIAELRQVSSDLSPTYLYDYGLFLAVNQLVKNVSRISTMNITFNSNLQNERLVSLVEITLYRIIQESINNAVKYSKAKFLKINLIQDAEFLELIVVDDGIGFDLGTIGSNNSRVGNGLKNINSRANLLGGKATMITSPGCGFQLSVHVPIENIQA